MDFLFDIGNVLFHVDFISSLKRIMPENIDHPEARLNRLLERKDDFEAGRIAPGDYYPWAAETLGHTGELDTFMEAWVDIFSPNQPMLDTVVHLHEQGHRLILFSNTNEAHIDFLRNHYPVFEHFDGAILSYQVAHVKPEQEIYQRAINDYRLTAENTLYIDDLPENVEGGKRAGFLSHQYKAQSHQDFLDWLDELLQTRGSHRAE